jgi:hypothetical protein
MVRIRWQTFGSRKAARTIRRTVLLGAVVALALPAAAQANNLFTLGSKASTNAIVTEAKGTGYAAWVQPAANPATEPEVVLFCEIPRGGTCTAPITLPLPSGTYEEIIQPFPVLGSHPGVVYVVGPRYIKNEYTLIWTSTDGGKTFSPAKSIHSASPGKTGVGDVLLDPNTPASAGPTEDYFGMAFNNPGLGFGFTANEITSGKTSFTFANPGEGGVASSTLGYVTHTVEDSFTKLQIHPEVEAYYNLSSPAPEVFFYRYYAKGGNVDGEESGWEGPFKVSDGYVPRLAGGPKGLFMLSTDIAPGESLEAQPSAIDVRKFNETTHTFEAPVMIAKIPTSAGTLFNSGDIYENPETGFLYVAQPVINGAGNYVMRLWESTNGGETFTGERDIAAIGFGYSEIPRLAVAADGQGWLTFKDAGGLEVADLSALPTPTPSTPAPTPTTLSTSQTAGTTTGANITVPEGTVGETDHATISGANAGTASGTVAYALYSKSDCSAASKIIGFTGTVTAGVAAASGAVTPALSAGTYYWQAAYSGDTKNLPSSSSCGSEALTITAAPKAGEGATSTGTTVTITITCTSTPCTVTITITIPTASAASARKSKKKPKPITLASGTFTLHKGGSQKVTLHLTKTGKKVLAAHHGHLTASLKLSEKIDGHTILSTKTIKIKPATKKHKK